MNIVVTNKAAKYIEKSRVPSAHIQKALAYFYKSDPDPGSGAFLPWIRDPE
jgi:hypothetical protein